MATQDVRVKFTGDPSDLKRATAVARSDIDALTKRVNAQKVAMNEVRGAVTKMAAAMSSGDREQDANDRKAKRETRAKLNDAAASADKEPPAPTPTADNTAADREKKTAEEIADLAFETARIRHQDRRDGMSDAEKIKDLTKDRLHLEQEIAKQSDPLKKAQMEKSLAELDSEINRIERSVKTVVEPTGGSGGGSSSAAPDAPAIDESLTPQEREHQAYVEQMRKGGRLPNPGIERRLRRDAQKSRMRTDRWNERGIGGPSGTGETLGGEAEKRRRELFPDFGESNDAVKAAAAEARKNRMAGSRGEMMGDGSSPSSAPNKTEDRLAAIEKAVTNMDKMLDARLPSKTME